MGQRAWQRGHGKEGMWKRECGRGDGEEGMEKRAWGSGVHGGRGHGQGAIMGEGARQWGGEHEEGGTRKGKVARTGAHCSGTGETERRSRESRVGKSSKGICLALCSCFGAKQGSHSKTLLGGEIIRRCQGQSSAEGSAGPECDLKVTFPELEIHCAAEGGRQKGKNGSQKRAKGYRKLTENEKKVTKKWPKIMWVVYPLLPTFFAAQ